MTPLTGGEEADKLQRKKRTESDEEEEAEQEAAEEEGAEGAEGEEEALPAEGEAGGEEEAAAEAPAPAEGAAAPETQPEVPKRQKKLPNAFNFCERAAMTYNNPFRVSQPNANRANSTISLSPSIFPRTCRARRCRFPVACSAEL